MDNAFMCHNIADNSERCIHYEASDISLTQHKYSKYICTYS